MEYFQSRTETRLQEITATLRNLTGDSVVAVLYMTCDMTLRDMTCDVRSEEAATTDPFL